jgi:hypothetical protein
MRVTTYCWETELLWYGGPSSSQRLCLVMTSPHSPGPGESIRAPKCKVPKITACKKYSSYPQGGAFSSGKLWFSVAWISREMRTFRYSRETNGLLT